MSTNELIAEARRIAALSPNSDAGKCFTGLVAALEISVREIADRKQSEGELVDMVIALADERDALTAERDALAAVVEHVRDTLEHYDRQKADVAPIDVLDMLPAPSVSLARVKAEALREAADAFEGATINVDIFGDSAEARYWQGANKSRGNLVASLRDRADRIEKGESNG